MTATRLVEDARESVGGPGQKGEGEDRIIGLVAREDGKRGGGGGGGGGANKVVISASCKISPHRTYPCISMSEIARQP